MKSSRKHSADILQNKSWKSVSPIDKTKAKELINAHHAVCYPDEKVSYCHPMFCAPIVYPDKKFVLPFAPEPIMKTDGSKKNDCERNAAKRLYADTRREHLHLKLIAVEDAICSNVPHLQDLKNYDIRYIIGVKQGCHTFLFNLIKHSGCIEYEPQTNDGTKHRYRYINQVQLNNRHPDFKVNFLEYWERDKNGKEQHFSWFTDLVIGQYSVKKVSVH